MVDVLKDENSSNKRELLKAGRELNERVTLSCSLHSLSTWRRRAQGVLVRCHNGSKLCYVLL